MPLVNRCPLLVATALLTSLAWADCLPFTEAKNHVGEVKCVTGMVVRIKQGARGVHFLDFCDDFRLCPFTVVIFPRDLKSVGDVRQLARTAGRDPRPGQRIRRTRGNYSRRIPTARRRRRQNSSPAKERRRGEKRPRQRRNLQPPQGKEEDLQEAGA